MENAEIIALWKSYDRKLEENLALNRKNALELTQIKVRSFLLSMRPIKIFAVLIGLFWVVLVDSSIITLFSAASPFFLISAGIQSLLTKLAIGIYLYQLVLIHQTDIFEPIVATQEKLSRLKASTLWVARLLFLQLPLWTTFYLNKSMFEHASTEWMLVQVLLTAGFTYLAFWLFGHIKYENRDKKWFRLIFTGREWEPMLRSMELLSQVEEYKKEE
ncbi:MAG: hypothetical protein U0X91_19010 [Spirosomataceae bacterium]